MVRYVLAIGLGLAGTTSALAYINAGFRSPREAMEYERLLRIDRKAAEAYRERIDREHSEKRRISFAEEEQQRRAQAAARFEAEVLVPLTDAIRRDPRNAQAHYRLARAIQKESETSKHNQRVLAALDRAIELEPKLALAYVRRARIVEANGDSTRYDQAHRDYMEAVRLEPNNVLMQTCAAAVNLLGRKLSDPAKGLEHAKIACGLTKERDPFPLQILALAYALKGERALAVRYQKEALRLFGPGDLVQSERDKASRFTHELERDRNLLPARIWTWQLLERYGD